MAERHVVSALKRKYGLLKGELQYTAPVDPEPLMRDIGHVGAVILMFSPTEVLTAIRPIRPHKGWRGRWTRRALGILRTERRAMTARALARRLLAAEGIPPTTEAISCAECALHATLGRLEGLGIVRVPGAPKRWRVE